MNPGGSPAHERAVTPAFFDGRAAPAQLDDAGQKATQRKPPDKGAAGSLFLRFLYWIYERRLLGQLQQRPMPRHIGIILDGNRRDARKRAHLLPSQVRLAFGFPYGEVRRRRNRG